MIMEQNPKYSYNEIPDMQTDWYKDPTNENKQFSGQSVQEFIKRQLRVLDGKILSAEILNPSKFDGFVDNVSLTNKNVGSDYDWIKYDTTRHMFFAVVAGFDDTPDKYYRLYDKFDFYNMGEFPNAFPYDRKLYVYGTGIYLWNGEALVSVTQSASAQNVRGIVTDYTSSVEPEPEPEEEENGE